MDDWMRLLNDTLDENLEKVINGYDSEEDKRFFSQYHKLIAAVEYEAIVRANVRDSNVSMSSYGISMDEKDNMYISVELFDGRGPPVVLHHEWVETNGSYHILDGKPQDYFEISKGFVRRISRIQG